MEATAIPLAKLYDTYNKAYVIPNYQRPYAWDAQKALDLLEAVLDDVNNNAKLTSLGTLLFCEVPVAGNHPFGDNTPNSNAPNTVWEVVDGQQRLTVFSLIGYCLKNKFDVLTNEGLNYNPWLDFELLYYTSRKKTGKNVPLLIRDEDDFDSGYRSDLAHLLQSFIDSLAPPPVGVRLLASLEKIKAWVDEYLDANNFPTFCEYLLQKCQVIQVLADDQDTAFHMFEPLNSTSEPLTAFEVYRSKVVRQINPEPKFTQTESLLDYDNTKRDEVI